MNEFNPCPWFDQLADQGQKPKIRTVLPIHRWLITPEQIDSHQIDSHQIDSHLAYGEVRDLAQRTPPRQP